MKSGAHVCWCFKVKLAVLGKKRDISYYVQKKKKENGNVHYVQRHFL